MPVVRVSVSTETFTLKSAPPDGFVELRQMSYGDKLHRQGLAMEGASNENEEMTLRMMQKRATQFDFKKCIVKHNLEYEEGKPFDFTNPATLDMLDPRVGEEISGLIDDLNNFDATKNEAEPTSLKEES